MEKWALLVCAVIVLLTESLTNPIVLLKLGVLSVLLALVCWAEYDLKKRIRDLDGKR